MWTGDKIERISILTGWSLAIINYPTACLDRACLSLWFNDPHSPSIYLSLSPFHTLLLSFAKILVFLFPLRCFFKIPFVAVQSRLAWPARAVQMTIGKWEMCKYACSSIDSYKFSFLVVILYLEVRLLAM